MAKDTAAAPRLSWAEACGRRLERHALAAPLPDARPADVVGAMCGAHAQVLSAAELSIGVRSAGLTRADIREALWTEHSLIKTFGPRGTVHLLPARDLPMWTGALAAVPASHGGLAEEARLTPEQTMQIVAAPGYGRCHGQKHVAPPLRDLRQLDGDFANSIYPEATPLWPLLV